MDSTLSDNLYDCIVIGGGPAGLTAGIYLARYRRNFIIFDNGNSRASLIPISHNFPGAIHGISGKKILNNLRSQFKKYHDKIAKETVLTINKSEDDYFSITTARQQVKSLFIILATGITDIEFPFLDTRNGIKNGLVRHCPVCDAYEVIDQDVGIICKDNGGMKEALFLRNYTDKVSILTLGKKLALTKNEKENIASKKINLIENRIIEASVINNKIHLLMQNNNLLKFDTLYSALGAHVHSDFAINLGAKHYPDKCLIVNAKQETSVPGLYAIGDIIAGLNQICVAMAQGAIAATAIHNKL